MASTSGSLGSRSPQMGAGGTYSITWTISGLTQPRGDYSNFRVTTSDGKSASANSQSLTTIGHSPGQTVTGSGEAYTSAWFSAGSGSVSIPADPPVPGSTSVSVSKSATYAPSNISWSWSSVANAASYAYSGAVSGEITGTGPVTLSNASAGTYSLTVTPKGVSGNGPSSSASITLSNQPVDTVAPTINSFTVTSKTETSITVSASATDSGNPTSGMDSLTFYMSAGYSYPAGQTPTFSQGSVAGGSGSFTYSGLTAGTYYSLGVYALDIAGNLSNQTIMFDVQTSTPQDTTPPTITAFSVSSVTESSITVSAAASDASGISQLRFYISQNGTASTPSSSITSYHGNVLAASGSYTFNTDGGAHSLVSGYYYTVEVFAVDGSPNGNFSTTSTITNVQTTVTTPPSDHATTTAKAIGSTQFQWFISGLSNPFNTTYYQQVAVFNSPFANDSATQPPGLISNQTAPASGTSTTTPTVINSGSVSADQSYTVYGGAKAANGRWYTAGEYTFWTRPLDFAWTTAKTKGQVFNLLATEWNALTSKLNGFSLYKELGTSAFTTAIKGQTFTAIMFNEVRNAIAGMAPPLAAPGSVVKDGDVLASQLNGLRDSLNSIP